MTDNIPPESKHPTQRFEAYITLTHTYSAIIEAPSEDDARRQAWDMPTGEVQRTGALKHGETDCISIETP